MLVLPEWAARRRGAAYAMVLQPERHRFRSVPSYIAKLGTRIELPAGKLGRNVAPAVSSATVLSSPLQGKGWESPIAISEASEKEMRIKDRE